ncbi:MAG: SMP-30/gluconolactonase/LRE family protein [Thermoguttaceae bacterium]
MKSDVELVVDAKALVGEGPVWHAPRQILSWVDIEGRVLHVHDPDGEPDTVYAVGCRVGAAVPRKAGGMVLATENGFEAYDSETGVRTPIADPESHLPKNRFNDGKCDVRGRFWAGTMSLVKESQAGSFYVLETDGTTRRLFGNVTTSNGLGWSPDGRTMYYIDTPTLLVEAFDFDENSGQINNRRTVVRFPDGVGRPDGMTVDAEGMLWVAHWDGGRVTRWDPSAGRLLRTVYVPADRVTCPAFGGRELDTLYITTARFGLDDEAIGRQPHAGGLFGIRPGVSGLPSYEFGG